MEKFTARTKNLSAYLRRGRDGGGKNKAGKRRKRWNRKRLVKLSKKGSNFPENQGEGGGLI